MKKIQLFASVALMSLAATSFMSCGSDDEEDKTDDPKKEVTDDKGSSDNQDATPLPEGWKKGARGYYCYNKWDEAFLPSVLPSPEASFKVDNSLFKDYEHSILGGVPRYGSLTWENASDYRMWSMMFYATESDFSAYVEKVKAAGFQGYEDSWDASDGDKTYRFYHPKGWFLNLNANSKQREGSDYDVTLDITDCIAQSQKSICGIPLPTSGLALTKKEDASYTIYDNDGNESAEKVDWNGSLISSEGRYWKIELGYECFTSDNAKEYVETLKNAGWTVDSTPSEESLQGNYYTYKLSKDGIAACLNVERYALRLLIVSDKVMLENY